ncbi:MAG: hypothetical protein V2A34_10905, partial [Lentisphaerota bacterium]
KAFAGSITWLGLLVGVVAQVPLQINYQGRLVNGTNLCNGSLPMELMLFTNDIGGLPVYVDSNSAVSVVDGLYSTVLGDQTVYGSLGASLLQSNLYLGVRVNGSVLLPRERITAVAYALLADGVKQGGITAGMLADGAIRSNAIASGAISSSHLANGAVTSIKIAPGAVSSVQLADGAVQAENIASNAVGRAQLAKAYLSGRINCALFVMTNNLEFTSIETNLAVSFAVPLSSTPIVTTALDTPCRPAALGMNPAVENITADGFKVNVTIPPTAVSVTNGNNAYVASMAIINGNPAMAYFDGDTDQYSFLRATDVNGMSWGRATGVCVNSGAIGDCSLAEINGNPAIAFYMSNRLYYARATDAGGDSWGAPLAVDSHQTTGYGACLRVVAGYPAIAYANASNRLFFVLAADASGGAWGTPVMVATNQVSESLWLAVIATNPAICYQSGTSDDLFYVRAVDDDGDVWNAPVPVVTNGNVGDGCCMVESDEQAAICYRNDTSETLDFIVSDEASGSLWSGPYDVDTNLYGSVLDMTLVDGTFPAIAYIRDGSPDRLCFSVCASSGGVTWSDPIELDTDRVSRNNVLCILAVRNAPAIAYYSRPNSDSWFTSMEDIRYIRSGNPPASTYINWIAIEP